jgi:hypothetical protein
LWCSLQPMFLFLCSAHSPTLLIFLLFSQSPSSSVYHAGQGAGPTFFFIHLCAHPDCSHSFSLSLGSLMCSYNKLFFADLRTALLILNDSAGFYAPSCSIHSKNYLYYIFLVQSLIHWPKVLGFIFGKKKKNRSQPKWTKFGKIRMNFGLNSVNFRNLKHKIRFGPHRNGRISPKFGLSRSNPRTSHECYCNRYSIVHIFICLLSILAFFFLGPKKKNKHIYIYIYVHTHLYVVGISSCVSLVLSC